MTDNGSNFAIFSWSRGGSALKRRMTRQPHYLNPTNPRATAPPDTKTAQKGPARNGALGKGITYFATHSPVIPANPGIPNNPAFRSATAFPPTPAFPPIRHSRESGNPEMSATRENPLADTPLDSCQPHHPGPTPSFRPIRHSRESGNPEMSAARESHRPIRLWIPAFAGMAEP